ncbi:DUF2804 domain-containing protein [Agarivorans sp. Toyoura001]|uniref:DUF2804 domain-containing protein n=1 Tax=Agarivorans sp. Toyoura001 TaxID=2283141 RepID=UPI0010F59E0D|nr:DUF2804 domain-containing protein [Agarivorans sp. Toyoura001]
MICNGERAVLKENLREIETKAAPHCLIDDSGKVQYGQFNQPIAQLGLAEFQYLSSMDKPASAWAKHFHYKQFQFVSVKTAHYILGFAIADIRYLGSGFCYVYNIAKQTLQEVSWLKPYGLAYGTEPSSMNSRAYINGKNTLSITIKNGQWQLAVETPFLSAELELVCQHSDQVMAMCSPTAYNGWTYTQKHNALCVSGNLSINGEAQHLNDALAGYDFSAGYMRRETSWRWASISAQLNDVCLGVNLAAGVNETGFNENVLWIDGQKQLLGPVHFEFTRVPASGSEQAPIDWHIYSADGRIDLHFSPLNCRQERLNLWLLKSNFRQYIGHFSGVLVDQCGQQHRLDKVLGLSEDHFARW